MRLQNREAWAAFVFHLSYGFEFVLSCLVGQFESADDGKPGKFISDSASWNSVPPVLYSGWSMVATIGALFAPIVGCWLGSNPP